jgi:hypothetical protein
MIKRNVITIMLLLAVVGCGVDENGSGKAESSPSSRVSVPHANRDGNAAIADPISDANKKITVIVHSPLKQASGKSEEEMTLLRKDVEELAKPLEDLVEGYDRILGDAAKMQEYEGKMAEGSDAYNKKVLSLVKNQLGQGQTLPAQ